MPALASADPGGGRTPGRRRHARIGGRPPGWRLRFDRRLALAAALLALVGCAPSGPDRVGVYAVWIDGAPDEDRAPLDDFFECLLHGSSMNQYWEGQAELSYRGSTVVAPPDASLRYDAAGAWLSAAARAGRLTFDPDDDRSVLVVFARHEDVDLVGGCGRPTAQQVAGRRVGVAFVRTYPLCWPTGDGVRNETQLALQELVETTDLLLGYAPCAGDGVCEGELRCDNPCDAFVGLACPGAPAFSWTGCDGGSVDGWVIQRVSHEGRDERRCTTCNACDFQPAPCGPDDPDCALAPRSDAGGCAQGGRRPAHGLGVLLAVPWLRRRVRRRRTP